MQDGSALILLSLLSSPYFGQTIQEKKDDKGNEENKENKEDKEKDRDRTKTRGGQSQRRSFQLLYE